ncbi:MAG: HEAT repeat domain-containing protein, partial [Planctomycetota bacterium]
MRLWKAVGLTLLLALARVGTAGEAPTLDEVVAELTGEAPMSERTKTKLRATYNSVLDLLLPKLGGKDLKAREQAQITLKHLSWHAARPGADEQRTALAKAPCARLEPQMPQPALLALLRRLETVGGEESVTPVTALLDAAPLARERARVTLAANPSPGATDALLDALGQAQAADWTVGLINALGARGDERVVPALIRHAASEDEAVRVAACDALAAIGDPRGADAIARATQKQNSKAALHAIGRAYLRMADQRCARAEKEEALEMYRQFLDSVPYLRCAAIIGLGRAGGPDEIPTLFQALADDSAEIRGAGRAALELLPVEAVRQAVAARAKSAQPQMLVQL